MLVYKHICMQKWQSHGHKTKRLERTNYNANSFCMGLIFVIYTERWKFITLATCNWCIHICLNCWRCNLNWCNGHFHVCIARRNSSCFRKRSTVYGEEKIVDVRGRLYVFTFTWLSIWVWDKHFNGKIVKVR